MKNQKSYTVEEATKVLEGYCAYQERCHKEVEQKLYDLNMIAEAKEIIILHLLKHNFLNEERFAKAFARGKFSIKNWGKIKITNELQFKNISSYNIKSALNEIDEVAYINTLEKIALKKFNQLKEPDSYKKKAKLTNFLISKGYEQQHIYEVTKTLSTKK
ncbi:regulatory protein RecX [Lutibacter sp.]|uniref:regulatory protein RecX n=1 Tax=Lutibacter sp. TaxID=1925666 RepID=UPI002733F691|nr:regulatory protein RecX [Lutibacter sp.]MDP3313621.1 regulatory protein RecX [Lutibacter sp.]